jgi:hypothetical protein
MTNNEVGDIDNLTLMIDLAEAIAEKYLTLHEMDPIRAEEPSRFELDFEMLDVEVGERRLTFEIQHVTAVYLFEAAHEIKSLSTLLRANQIAGSLEVLSRASIERCGRVSWLLDHNSTVNSSIRAARISLEIAVSLQHYREIIQSRYSKGHEANKRATSVLRMMRADMEKLFAEIDKPKIYDGRGALVDSPDIRGWILDGCAYPDYTELATWAWFGSEDNQKSAKATYKTLCAFSHPSVAASREHSTVIEGRLTHEYEVNYINKVLGNSVASFNRAFQSFCSYFDRNFPQILELSMAIDAQWPSLADIG